VNLRGLVLAVLAGSSLAAVPGFPLSASAGQEVRPSLTVTHTARAHEPGEVLLIAVEAAVPLASVRVSGLGAVASLHAVTPSRWQGLLGIDLDVAPGDHTLSVEASDPDGVRLTGQHRLKVDAREFRVRRLQVPARFADPPASALPRIEREAQLLATLFKTTTPERAWEMPFSSPVDVEPNSAFGVRTILNGKPRGPHSGADFPCPAGTPVHAPNRGRVVLAQDLYFAGQTVIVDHGEGLYSLFAHLSRFDVGPGDSVARGDVVGAVGATGRVTGPHLHWAVRLHDARVDPMSLLHVVGRESEK
jgi:murein DD-endopeptidase MepM/ murein hydrolase activator NlpD